MFKPKYSPAFTLIELLIVIAIVAIIAALLLPVYGRVRDAADATTCVSNMRNITSAIVLYAGEHQNSYPAPDTKLGGDQWPGWVEAVQPYLGASSATSMKAFACPTQRKNMQGLSGTYPGDKCNFALNWILGPNGNYPYWRRLTAVSTPSKTIMLSEAGIAGGGSNYGTVPQLDDYWLTQSTKGSKTPGGVHAGSNNIAWCDGHVSTWKDIATLTAQPYCENGPQDMWSGGIVPSQP